MRRLRILFCLEDLCFGGTQRQMIALASRLDRARFAPELLVCTGRTDLDDTVRAADIPITYVGKSRRVPLTFFAKLGYAIRQSNPDLLVPCTALPNIWARIWGRVFKIPVLGTCRGGGAPKRQHERVLWRLTKHIVCNTEQLKEELCRRRIPESHISVIPNGIATENYAPTNLPSERPPTLLCVARLAEDKDHRTLFRAFQMLHTSAPNATLSVLGDGPLALNLRSWANTHPNLPITFFPGTTDVRPYYAAARIFVLSSVREGQPNVLLEAMSAGLPICATAVGGIPAMITHGKTGLLSEPGDSSSLAANILHLLEKPAEADSLGRAAREEVTAHYSFASMVAAHEALFLRYAKQS